MEGLVLLLGAVVGFISLVGGALMAVAAMTGGPGPDEPDQR